MNMNRHQFTPPNQNTVTSSYRKPVIDKLLGRTTLKWECDDGHNEELTASLRFTDYEGNLPSLYSVARLPYVMKTYLQSRQSPIMRKPVPFIVLDAIKFLDGLIRPGLRVLELGGGNSSLWFLDKGVNLYTYEHDVNWAQMVLGKVRSDPGRFNEARFNLKVMQGTETINDLSKLDNEFFDIVLIDSMNDFTRRNDCIRAALKKIKPGGWLVLDNSDNPVNWNGAELLSGKEMHRFTGFSPMALFVCQTTFWRI
jgi:predicted O-methyltransferase YrrM